MIDRAPAVVVTDRHLVTLIEPVRSALDDCPVIVLEPGEPTVDTVSGLVGKLDSVATIVAVGGGSVIDSAKLAAAVAGSGSSVRRHLLGAEVFSGRIPVVAVPTTAGTGSEATRTSILTVDGHKSWAWDELLRPTAVVLDASLTVGMPRSVTAATGLDAFVHAAEAATAQRRDAVADAAAAWAISYLVETLPMVLAAPADLEARSRVLAASTAAGVAIDRCGTGIAHGLGHALGSLVPIPHGFAVGLCLWVAAEFNQTSGDPRCDTVAGSCGASGYADAVDDLVERVGLADHLRSLAESHRLDGAALAAGALSQLNEPMRLNNVRLADADDVGRLAVDVARRWDELGGRV